MFDNLTLAGIPILLGIFGLVSFAKSLGATGKVLTILSFGLGVIVFALFKGAELFPGAATYIEAVWFILAGPAVSGIYDQTKEWITGAR